MKILITYYSGVGNTKMVAQKIYEILKDVHEVTIVSIEKSFSNIEVYDALVIGFPTIHAAPAKPIMNAIKQMKCLQRAMPTFIFTTCGLFSANTLRTFAKKSVKKNISPVLSKSYRCAATDGVLIAPYINVWWNHEKGLDKKIQNHACNFIALLNKPIVSTIPRFKLYGILNYPNKFLGQRFSPKIYTHKENCIACGKCSDACPIQNISKDNAEYPLINNEFCIHCYRCIHHCPKRALSLSKKKPPSKTLYY